MNSTSRLNDSSLPWIVSDNDSLPNSLLTRYEVNFKVYYMVCRQLWWHYVNIAGTSKQSITAPMPSIATSNSLFDILVVWWHVSRYLRSIETRMLHQFMHKSWCISLFRTWRSRGIGIIQHAQIVKCWLFFSFSVSIVCNGVARITHARSLIHISHNFFTPFHSNDSMIDAKPFSLNNHVFTFTASAWIYRRN